MLEKFLVVAMGTGNFGFKSLLAPFMPFKSGFNSLYLDMSGRTLRVASL